MIGLEQTELLANNDGAIKSGALNSISVKATINEKTAYGPQFIK